MRLSWRTWAVAVTIPAVLLGFGAPGAGAADDGWGPVEDVGVPGPAEAGPYDVRVVVADDGSALAVVRAQGDHRGRRLFAARRSADSAAWGPTKAVSGSIGWGSFDVAAGPRGSFSVVWEHADGKVARIEERHLSAGSWSSVARIGRGLRPSVAIDGAGTVLAVWGASALNTSRRSPDGGWSRPRQLVHELVRQPTVDVNAAGDAVVAWWTHSGGKDGPWKARAMVQRKGSWKSARTMIDSPFWSAWGQTLVAQMGPAGRAIVLAVRYKFARPGGYRNAVVWSRSHADGTWSRTRFLTRELLEDGGNLGLSMNASGQALATWSCADSNGSYVQADRFRRDGTWGDPRTVGPARGWTSAPRAWLDDAGVAHLAAWRRDAYLAYAQRPDHAWTGPVRIGHGEYGDASGQGTRMVAMWFGGGVHARVLDAG